LTFFPSFLVLLRRFPLAELLFFCGIGHRRFFFFGGTALRLPLLKFSPFPPIRIGLHGTTLFFLLLARSPVRFKPWAFTIFSSESFSFFSFPPCFFFFFLLIFPRVPPLPLTPGDACSSFSFTGRLHPFFLNYPTFHPDCPPPLFSRRLSPFFFLGGRRKAHRPTFSRRSNLVSTPPFWNKWGRNPLCPFLPSDFDCRCGPVMFPPFARRRSSSSPRSCLSNLWPKETFPLAEFPLFPVESGGRFSLWSLPFFML